MPETIIQNLPAPTLAYHIERYEREGNIGMMAVLGAEWSRRVALGEVPGQPFDLTASIRRSRAHFACDRCEEIGQIVEVFC